MEHRNAVDYFSTPDDLITVIVRLLDPKSEEKIYDGAFGGLGFLIGVKKYIEQEEKAKVKPENLFGREINKEFFEQALAIASQNGLAESNFYLQDVFHFKGGNSNEFDVVLSSPPFGLRSQIEEGELGIITSNGTNKYLQHYINSLKLGGRAAVIIADSFLFDTSTAGIALRKYMLTKCNICAILGLPRKTFSYTAINASVLFFIKGEDTKYIKYYKKKDDGDYDAFMDFYKDSISDEQSFMFSVDSVLAENYLLPTADQLLIEKEVDDKSENFKEFKDYKINDICLEINLTRDRFEEKDNTVYLPKIGKSPCVDSIEKTTLKHQNYFQLVLDGEIISSGYMAYYLRSSLGKLLLDRCYTGITIPNITKRSLVENMEVYAPGLEDQRIISTTFDTLDEVKFLMEKTALELSSNPNSAKIILEKLNNTKLVFNELSEEEKIQRLIKGGENLRVEFKETLSRNIHTQAKDKNLQSGVLKNIVGFLNKSGGQLLIGVADDGEIKGIEKDFYSSDDNYKLQLSNLINDRIGLKEASYIDLQIHTVRSKKICLINCLKAKSPAYLDGDFYIRTDPECRKLSAKEATEYIRENFD